MSRSGLAVLVLAGILTGQGTTVPPAYVDTRGNDALSLPIRWHQGLLQVLLKSHNNGGVVPAEMLKTNLKEVVVRRPAFLGEPAYPALTRTFTVRLASTTLAASALVKDMGQNQKLVAAAGTTLTSVVTAKSFNIAATPASPYRSVVGADLVRVPFSAPYAFAGPDLFVEWKTTSTDLLPSTLGWVDALVLDKSGDHGIAVTLGQGGCSSLTPGSGLPMTLEADGQAVKSNSSVILHWRNAHPKVPALLMAGPKLLDPRKSSGPFKVYSPVLSFLRQFVRPGCHFWTEPLFASGTVIGGAGSLDSTLAVPQITAADLGFRYVLQGAVLPANGAPAELTNGLAVFAGSAGVRDWAGMVLSPVPEAKDSTGKTIPPTSPWPVFQSSLPVLRFNW